MLTKQELKNLVDSANTAKSSWDSTFFETFSYTMPERNYVWRVKDTGPQSNKQIQLFTTAGKIGASVFVARIQNKLSPYEKPYFQLKIKESVDDSVESEMRDFGEALSDRINEVKNAVKLDDVLNESYFDLVAGTACIMRSPTMSGIRFYKIPLTNFALGTENTQTVARYFELPGAIVGSTFPELAGKRKIGSAYINEHTKWDKIKFTDVLFYNENSRLYEYYLMQGDDIVLTRIYDSNPYYLLHWDRASDMPFGTGVGTKALPNLKRLNSYIKCNLQLLPFRFPMFLAKNGSIVDRNINYKPGGFIWTSDPSSVVPLRLDTNSNTGFELEVSKEEMEIKQIMLDYTLPADPRQMTAAEVYARTSSSDEVVYSNVSKLTNVIKQIGWDILRDVFERELAGSVDFDFAYLQSIYDMEINNESSVDTNLVQKIQGYIQTVGAIDPQAVWESLPRSKTLVELQKGFNLPADMRRTADEIDEVAQANAQAQAQAQNDAVQQQMAIDANKEQAIADREEQIRGA